MGLFDPPTKAIAKRVPVSAQMGVIAVQSLAEVMIPEYVGKTKHSCLAVMVMAVWVNAHARAGTFDMRQRDLTYVMNMYSNCGRIVGDDYCLMGSVIEHLIEHDQMPEGFKEFYEEDREETSETSVTDRYPHERWDNLFMVMYLRLEAIRRKMGLDSIDPLLSTRFCKAYIAGFPNELAGEDERFAGIVRKGALGFIYGASKGLEHDEWDIICRDIFETVLNGLAEKDPQTVIGFSCGSSDGERFFQTVAANEHPYVDENFADLFAMVDAGKIDLTQTN